MNRTVSSITVAPLVLHAETAADLMVPNPISLRAEAKVAEAITLFTEKGIAAAPVIDDAGRPIGVLSRSDVLVHHCEHHRHGDRMPDYFFAGSDAPIEGRPSPGATVAELMTPAVFAVAPDTPVHRVVSDMIGLHVHRLFVVDDAGVLVGVISAMDILRRLEAEE